MTRQLPIAKTRVSIVVFAIFASVIMVTSMPAAAASVPTATVEGDSHTTDTELANGTLTNMSVTGSGTSASAVASTGGSDIDLSGTNVTGASESFQLGDYDSVTSGPTLEMTGVLNTEWDNVSESGVANGDTLSVDVADTGLDPIGPSANGEPTVTFTGNPIKSSHSIVTDEGDGNTDVTRRFIGDDEYSGSYWKSSAEVTPSKSGDINELTVDIAQATGSDYGFTVDVYIDSGGMDTTYSEGTKVATWDPSWETGEQTIPLDSPYTVTSGSVYELEFIPSGTDNDGIDDILYIGVDDSASSNKVDFRLNDDSASNTNPEYADINLSINEPTENVSVDIDRDGTDDASYSGTLNKGESVTKEISGLTNSDDTWNVGVDRGKVNISAKFKERVQTQDPGVALNGDNQSYSGTLAEGDTTTFTWPDSALTKNGENTVDVNLPDLSDDAPPMTADYQFTTTTSKKWSSAEYVSANYSLANVTEMSVDVDMANADGTFYLDKWTGSSWSVVSSTSIASNGTHTLNPSTIGDSNTVRARVEFDKTASNPYAEIKSDTAFFKAHGASATGQDRSTNNEDVTVSATIDDADFTDPQGDNVTAEIYWKGTLVKTVSNITNSSTVSYSRSSVGDGNHNWHVETTDDYGVTHTSDTYTLTVNHYAPDVDNSSLSPTGDLQQPDQTLKAAINDTDFAEPSGDSVTATFYVKQPDASSYSSVGSQTITSNTSVSTSYTADLGGNYQWYVNATDEYGQTTISETKSFNAPAQLYIRNISNYNLVNTTSDVSVTFYGSNSGSIVTKTTTDGTVDFTGLPVNDKFVAKIDASNYHERRIIIESLYDQRTAFIVSDNTTALQTNFALKDLTGNYPPAETYLQIQREINTSAYPENANNSIQWRAVSGDYFDAADTVRTLLIEDQRYRLRIVNGEGDIRALGSYTPQTAQEQTLTVGTVKWPTSDETIYAVDAWEFNESNQTYIRFAYTDPDNKTEKLEVSIHEQGDPSDKLLDTEVDGPLGNYTEVVTVSNTSKTWVANWSSTRSGSHYGSAMPVGKVGTVPIPIDGNWLTPAVYLILIGLMSMTPKASARSGAVVVAGLGIMIWWFGWAPLSGPAVGVAGAIALIGKASDYAGSM